jgi:hypothetical protein
LSRQVVVEAGGFGLGFEKTLRDGEMIHKEYMGGGGGTTVAATIDGIGRVGGWMQCKAPASMIDRTIVGITMPMSMTMEGERGNEITWANCCRRRQRQQRQRR